MDMQWELDLRKCESISAANSQRVWLVDCQNLADHLKKPTLSRCSDERLIKELAALGQMLGQLPDGTIVDE